ncbi:MAG: helix-turn-helix domain-containing protein [Candidatus Melainabacteria bacterium]|nr:helix-turn-helix domain-containing protein [Candidatus Melainabacteria bacterium]
MSKIRQTSPKPSPDTIRSYITRLRTKLGHDAVNPLIVTVHGVGYKLEP